MAGTLESLVFKPVQELAMDCKVLPERYIHKCPDEAFYVDPPVIDIPVIDLNLIQFPSASADQVLETLRTSLSSCGCFQVFHFLKSKQTQFFYVSDDSEVLILFVHPGNWSWNDKFIS